MLPGDGFMRFMLQEVNKVQYKMADQIKGRIIYLLLMLSVSMLTACSSGKIKELTTVEMARQILVDQQNNGSHPEKHPIKLNYVVSNKPVIGRETEVEVEVVSEKGLSGITLALETSAGLRFRKKWLVLSRPTVTKNMGTIKADTLYRYKVVVVPEKEGALHLTVYAIYKQEKEQRVKKSIIDLSIGNAPATGVKYSE